MFYDYVVVGGGFSGFYVLYKLVKQNPHAKFVLLEKKGRFGGRIKTVHREDDGTWYDTGAVRISCHHERVLSLIKSCGLKTIVIEEEELQDKKERHPILKIRSKYWGKPWLERVSVSTMMDAVENKMDMYQTAFLHKNAYDYLMHFEENYLAPRYYTVQGGLEELIRYFRTSVEGRPNVSILQENCVQSVDVLSDVCYVNVKNIQSGVVREIKTRKLIMTLPPKDLEEITVNGTAKYFQKIHHDYMGSNSYIRIYGGGTPFPSTEKKWKRTVFPQLYQLVYTDGDRARKWLEYLSLASSETQLLNFLKKKARFKKIEWFDFHYWKHGTYYWKVGFSSKKYLEKMQEIKRNCFYLGGEPYSTYQGWIEGCVESMDNILFRFGETEIWRWQPTNKYFDQAAVQKAKYWTIFRGGVYDLTYFRLVHPGGRKLIEMAFGKDVTALFEMVGHSEYALQWMQNYKIGKYLSLSCIKQTKKCRTTNMVR